METSEDRKLVFVDASVLINFLHLDQLGFFGDLGEYRFAIPEEVKEKEILRPEQRARLLVALKARHLFVATSTDLREVEIAADLRQVLDRGEAACLAMAERRGGLVACDERGRFLSEARARIGLDRVLNTPGLLLVAIRRGVLDVQAADRWKRLLEENRYKMRFNSFADLL